MASFSDYTENGVLNHLFNGTAFNIAGQYLALFQADTGLEENNISAAAEVPSAGTGYARINIAQLGGFTEATTGSVQNAATMDFPIATADWGTITHTAIVDAATGGNVVCWGPLLNSRSIFVGDAVRVPLGALTVTLS